MAQIQLFSSDNFHENPQKELEGSWKKGYFVAVQEDGRGWAYDDLQDPFIIISVPEEPVESFREYLKIWNRELVYGVNSYDQNIDAYNFCISGNGEYISSVSDLGRIQASEVEQDLNNWNIEITTTANNDICCNAEISAIFTSKGFCLDNSLTDVTITEISYDSETQMHTVSADYSKSEYTAKQVEGLIKVNHLQKIYHDYINKKLKVLIYGPIVFTAVKDFLSRRFNNKVCFKKFYFDNDKVDEIRLNYGRKYVMDKTTFNSFVRNKTEDI